MKHEFKNDYNMIALLVNNGTITHCEAIDMHIMARITRMINAHRERNKRMLAQGTYTILPSNF